VTGGEVINWDLSGSVGELAAELSQRGLLVRSTAMGEKAPIRGVALDSRLVRPGDVFVAIHGTRVDGQRFATQAVGRGAAAVITEVELPDLVGPQLLVTAARPASAVAAAWVCGFPSRHLRVIGVTGTDGKSTTCWLTRLLLDGPGSKTGMVSTVGVVVDNALVDSPGRMTTPDAPELQAYLAQMVGAGDRYAVIEASSHGLDQFRVGEVAFDVAVLTNLGHEHLDYHGTPARYRAAKRRLFESLAVSASNPSKGIKKLAIVNAGERHRAEFIAAARASGAEVLTFGLGAGADVRGTSVRPSADGHVFNTTTPSWRQTIELPLPGRFNVMNALAAMAVAEGFGLEGEFVASRLRTSTAVPGRMQEIDEGQPFRVIVDYAHTPEALRTVLRELRAVQGCGGIISVFGSAGDRDLEKRPLMGREAARMSRLVIVTEEDPRSEDQALIGDQIARGAQAEGLVLNKGLEVIGDRAEAIRAACASAKPGDIVLLAGKGHEKTIERAEGAIPWDEAAEARATLRELGFGRLVS
jgi:UDP-N-acetylmuramoyl-L-alanyl-D-glutamate--2,6-diaminopimelate ligase